MTWEEGGGVGWIGEVHKRTFPVFAYICAFGHKCTFLKIFRCAPSEVFRNKNSRETFLNKTSFRRDINKTY